MNIEKWDLVEVKGKGTRLFVSDIKHGKAELSYISEADSLFSDIHGKEKALGEWSFHKVIYQEFLENLNVIQKNTNQFSELKKDNDEIDKKYIENTIYDLSGNRYKSEPIITRIEANRLCKIGTSGQRGYVEEYDEKSETYSIYILDYHGKKRHLDKVSKTFVEPLKVTESV